jgi:hypothetical protein
MDIYLQNKRKVRNFYTFSKQGEGCGDDDE